MQAVILSLAQVSWYASIQRQLGDVSTGSLLGSIPILLWYLFSGNFPHALSLRALSGLIYLSVVTSIICNFIWFSISTRLGAGLTAISLFAQPLVGSLIGLLFLNEPLTISLIVGAILVFVALYLITIAPLTASKSVEVRPASLPLTDI